MPRNRYDDKDADRPRRRYREDEYKFDPNGPLPALGHPKRDTFIAAMVDGSVRQCGRP